MLYFSHCPTQGSAVVFIELFDWIFTFLAELLTARSPFITTVKSVRASFSTVTAISQNGVSKFRPPSTRLY